MEKLVLMTCTLGAIFLSFAHGKGATMEDIEKLREYHNANSSIVIRSLFEDHERKGRKACNALEAKSKVRVRDDEKYVALNGWMVPSMETTVILPLTNETIITRGVLNCKMQTSPNTFKYIYYVSAGPFPSDFLEAMSYMKFPYVQRDECVPDRLLLLTDAQHETRTEPKIKIET